MPGTLGLCGGLTALAPTCTGAWMPYLRQAGNVLFFFFSGKPVLKRQPCFLICKACFNELSKTTMLLMNTRKVDIWMSSYTSSHGIS